MRIHENLALRVGLLALALAGCQPKIGDACSVATDCSSNGDRLCDATQPGGYCTEFNCRPGTCPTEAICVAFSPSVSNALACRDPQDDGRLRRTFCMRTCSSRSDCRDAYQCVDMGDPDNPWGALVEERRGGKHRVCSVPFEAEPVPTDAGAAVCTGSDAGFDASSGGGGAAGSGAAGAGGASGAAGAGGASGGAGAGGASGGAGAGGASGGAGVAGRG